MEGSDRLCTASLCKFRITHVGAGSQSFGPSSTAFPSHKQRDLAGKWRSQNKNWHSSGILAHAKVRIQALGHWAVLHILVLTLYNTVVTDPLAEESRELRAQFWLLARTKGKAEDCELDEWLLNFPQRAAGYQMSHLATWHPVCHTNKAQANTRFI